MPHLIRPIADAVVATHGWFPIRPIGCTTNCEHHEAMDYAAKVGTPVRAAAAGTVVRAEMDNRTAGNWIVLKHDGVNEGLYTRYLHLKNFAKGISRGATVYQGQVIAYSGESASEGIPHLHFDIQAVTDIGEWLKALGLALWGRKGPGTVGYNVPVEQFLPEPNMNSRFAELPNLNVVPTASAGSGDGILASLTSRGALAALAGRTGLGDALVGTSSAGPKILAMVALAGVGVVGLAASRRRQSAKGLPLRGRKSLYGAVPPMATTNAPEKGNE